MIRHEYFGITLRHSIAQIMEHVNPKTDINKLKKNFSAKKNILYHIIEKK